MRLNLDRIVLRKYFENCPGLDYNLYLTILKFRQNITELFFLKTAANPSHLDLVFLLHYFFSLLNLGMMNKVSSVNTTKCYSILLEVLSCLKIYFTVQVWFVVRTALIPLNWEKRNY